MKTCFLSIFAAAALLSGCAKPSERTELTPEKTADVKGEIQQLENAYADAVNADNTDKLMNYYAEDAISYNADGPPLKGKEAIRTDILRHADAFPKSAKIMFTVQEVLPSSDANQVVEIGRYQIKDEKDVEFGSGNYFSLFEKRGDKYVCIRDMQTPDTPKKKP